MWSEWSIAQIALVVSGLSFALALASFVWSVWSKFIYPKPNLKVNVYLALFEESLQRVHYFPPPISNLNRIDKLRLSMPAITVSVSNHGPGKVDTGTPLIARKRPHHPKKEGYALFNEFVSYPWQLLRDEDQKKISEPLEVGMNSTFYIPFSQSEYEEWKISSIGFIDAYGRKHFCDRRAIRTLGRAVDRYFSKAMA